MKMRERLAWSLVIVVGIVFAGAAARGVMGGALDPTAPPASTMKSLDDIPGSRHRSLPSVGADVCSSPRFDCVLNDQAVLDRETGLVWQRNPAGQSSTWVNALDGCWELEIAGRKGWRLPTMEEHMTLVFSTASPALPPLHPFQNIQATTYWSITTLRATDQAFLVDFADGENGLDAKTASKAYWCVRAADSPFDV